MIKAVLDTNIFVSALFWKGAPHEVVRKGIAGSFIVLTSPALISELQKILTVKFAFPRDETRDYLCLITARSALVEPKEEPRVVAADPSDDKVIACAIAAGAGYIVTGDTHLLSLGDFSGIRILTSSAFLAILKA